MYSPEIAIKAIAIGISFGYLWAWKPKIMVGIAVALGLVSLFIPDDFLVEQSLGWLPYLFKLGFFILGNLMGKFLYDWRDER